MIFHSEMDGITKTGRGRLSTVHRLLATKVRNAWEWNTKTCGDRMKLRVVDETHMEQFPGVLFSRNDLEMVMGRVRKERISGGRNRKNIRKTIDNKPAFLGPADVTLIGLFSRGIHIMSIPSCIAPSICELRCRTLYILPRYTCTRGPLPIFLNIIKSWRVEDDLSQWLS